MFRSRLVLFTLSLAVVACISVAKGFQAVEYAYRVPRSDQSKNALWVPRGGSVKSRPKRRLGMSNDDALSLRLPQNLAKTQDRAIDKSQDDAKKEGVGRLDMLLYGVYLCTCVGSTLPVILMPLIAAEQAAIAGPGFVPGAFVAMVASIASLGGGVGKILNGFVCQAFGGRNCSSLYLLGITACLLSLSFAQSGSMIGWILAGLEFQNSAQWPACSLVLSNHFGHDPARFAKAITVLSLASTSGVLLGKFGGTALLPFVPSWRMAARLGAGVTLLGSLLMATMVTEYPDTALKMRANGDAPSKPPGLSFKQIGTALRNVAGSRLFWIAGLGHSTTYLVRTSDRVLGALFQDVTALPRNICGLLTAGLTLGFVHGIGKASGFHLLPDMKSKMKMLRTNYGRAVGFTLLLGLFSVKQFAGMVIPSKMVLAALLTFLSGAMASSLAFQFYQIPPQVANAFGENKAVCLSFLDAMGFFMSALTWGTAGKIVGSLGDYGWPTTFLLLGGLFGGGAMLMSSVYPEFAGDDKKTTKKA